MNVLVTGMSGTGKTTVLAELARRGHRTVDADGGEWCRWAELPDGSRESLWREERITALLDEVGGGPLVVAGCCSNQGRFYDRFEQVVLLSAPVEVILARVASRTGNPYGKTARERAEIRANHAEVEPLLRATATVEIDAAAPLDQVVRRLEELLVKPTLR